MGVSTSATRYVDLTTYDRVRRLIAVKTAVVDADLDAVLAQLITQVSRDMADAMGLHTLSARRTDYYTISPFRTLLTLKAKPVTAVFSVKSSLTRDFSGASSMTQGTDYQLDLENGVIEFTDPIATRTRGLIGQPRGQAYVEVDCTSGLGANAGEVQTNFADIAAACEAQVAELYQRGQINGFDSNRRTGQDGGTSFTGAYRRLPHVQVVIDRYMRRPY